MNLTLELEGEIKSFCNAMTSIWMEASDIYKLYWSAGPSSELSGLSGGDPATQASKLTKTELLAGLALAEQLMNFFNNASVTQADYIASIQTILYGNDPISVPISVAVEAVGSRLYSLAGTLLSYHNKAESMLNLYTDTEISLAVAAISDETIVFGSNITKSLLISGLTLVEQFNLLLTNQLVTTGDYAATLAKWEQVN